MMLKNICDFKCAIMNFFQRLWTVFVNFLSKIRIWLGGKEVKRIQTKSFYFVNFAEGGFLIGRKL